MKKLFFIFMMILALAVFLGNMMPPWFACDGKQAGDPCTWGYINGQGVCALRKNCTDNPNTKVNECLVCVKP